MIETSYILKGKNRGIAALKLEVKAEIIKVDIQWKLRLVHWKSSLQKEKTYHEKSLQKIAFQGVERCGIIWIRSCDLPEEGVNMSKLQERNVANERVYTVEEIAREARISRTAAYELVKKGLFPVIRVGSSIRIPKKPFDAWLDGRGD